MGLAPKPPEGKNSLRRRRAKNGVFVGVVGVKLGWDGLGLDPPPGGVG